MRNAPRPDAARTRPPAFLVSVDTEGDDLWSRPAVTTTRNAAFLPRFQALCERTGVRPTYLVDYEMAVCPVFRAFGREVLARGTAEIGAHLHPWNSPPAHDLTGEDARHLPYATDYPAPVLEAKLRYLTALLAETFGVRPVTHRAGRWGFDATYAALLLRTGYRVDCSVTPNVSWRGVPGAPHGPGGPDYRGFPEVPYFLDPLRIDRAGASPLLEVPMTVATFGGRVGAGWRRLFAPGTPPRRAFNRFFPEAAWLRPTGAPPDRLAGLLRRLVAAGRPHLQFMIHSSELMPGGHPALPDEAAIDRVYAEMADLFAAAAAACRPLLHREFYAEVAGGDRFRTP